MKRLTVIAALVLVTVPLSGLARPISAQVRRAPQPPGRVELMQATDLPMQLHGGRPVVEGRLDGQGPLPILVDTGAGGTVLDLSLVEELGLSVVGRALVGSPAGGQPVEGQLVDLRSLELGGLRIEEMRAVALDLRRVLDAVDAPRVVLSPHVLAGMLVTFDFPAQRLLIEHGSLAEVESMSYGTERPFPAAPVRIGEVEVLADVDTGSGHGLSLPASWTARFELGSALTDARPGRSVAGEIPAQEALLGEPVLIAGHRHDNLTVRFTNPGDLVNVGAAILKDYVVTIDPASRRFTLRYAAGS